MAITRSKLKCTYAHSCMTKNIYISSIPSDTAKKEANQTGRKKEEGINRGEVEVFLCVAKVLNCKAFHAADLFL